jgi:hypothetical protein
MPLLTLVLVLFLPMYTMGCATSAVHLSAYKLGDTQACTRAACMQGSAWGRHQPD